MKFITLDRNAVRDGATVCDQYVQAVACGRDAADIYSRGMNRRTGAHALPGALRRLIELGMTSESALVHAAGRVTRCKRSTALAVLHALTGVVAGKHLWTLTPTGYRVLEADARVFDLNGLFA